MNQKDVLSIFRELGVIREHDHFAYTSKDHNDGWYHGDTYLAKEILYPYVEITASLCKEIAKRCQTWEIDCVVGPEKGGIILSQWVGYFLAKINRQQILSVFAEKNVSNQIRKNKFRFMSGYGNLIAGQHVLIVDDVIHTGETVEHLISLVRDHGGIVKGVGALANRGSMMSAQDFGIPYIFALLTLPLMRWSADTCNLCQQGIPINTQFGHGKEFLEQMGRQ